MKNTKVKILVSNEYGNNYSVSGLIISEVYSKVETNLVGIHRSSRNYTDTSSVQCVVVKLDNGEIVRDVPISSIGNAISFYDLLERYNDGWGDL